MDVFSVKIRCLNKLTEQILGQMSNFMDICYFGFLSHEYEKIE